MSHGGPETGDSKVTASIVDAWLGYFKEIGIMESLTSKSNRWLRKTTAAGMIPFLLVQAFIAIFCVPQTFADGKEKLQKVTWRELPLYLTGEEQVTIRVPGGAVRGDVVSVQENGIHLEDITMATDSQRYPSGAEALILRDAVKEIRFETLQGKMRNVGTAIGAIGGLFLVPGMTVGLSGVQSEGCRAMAALAGMIAGSVGFGWLGHRLGKKADLKTIVIKIAN